jgi:hypothetical protein
VVEDDAEFLSRVSDPQSGAVVERGIRFHVEAWDVNCPQHITPRYTEEEIAPLVDKLQTRIAELEAELAACRAVV